MLPAGGVDPWFVGWFDETSILLPSSVSVVPAVMSTVAPEPGVPALAPAGPKIVLPSMRNDPVVVALKAPPPVTSTSVSWMATVSASMWTRDPLVTAPLWRSIVQASRTRSPVSKVKKTLGPPEVPIVLPRPMNSVFLAVIESVARIATSAPVPMRKLEPSSTMVGALIVKRPPQPMPVCIVDRTKSSRVPAASVTSPLLRSCPLASEVRWLSSKRRSPAACTSMSPASFSSNSVAVASVESRTTTSSPETRTAPVPARRVASSSRASPAATMSMPPPMMPVVNEESRSVTSAPRTDTDPDGLFPISGSARASIVDPSIVTSAKVGSDETSPSSPTSPGPPTPTTRIRPVSVTKCEPPVTVTAPPTREMALWGSNPEPVATSITVPSTTIAAGAWERNPKAVGAAASGSRRPRGGTRTCPLREAQHVGGAGMERAVHVHRRPRRRTASLQD